MKYCEIFLRSGETMRSEAMEENEVERLIRCFKEQTPGIQEFEDDEGVFLLGMTDVICVCCNNERIKRAVGFSKTETP